MLICDNSCSKIVPWCFSFASLEDYLAIDKSPVFFEQVVLLNECSGRPKS